MSRRVAIVTGSATGIGAAAALELGRRGCDVLINCSRSVQEAEETAARCRALGVDAIVAQSTIGEHAVAERLVQQATTRWGRVDFLVNNAARTKFASYKDLNQLSTEDFLDIYRVNVVGAYHMVRAASAWLEKTKGAVVNVASVGGYTGISSSIAYAASKAAMMVMTQSLAVALGPDVRVNAVAPGVVRTRWLRQGADDATYNSTMEIAAAAAPLHKVIEPEEIADVIAWLLLGASSLTGEVIVADAGARWVYSPPAPNKQGATEAIR